MTDMSELFRSDHTGFSVSSLEDAVLFWTQVMGFKLVRQGEMEGEFLTQTTGIAGARVRMALVHSADGYPVELLEYSTKADLGPAPISAGAVGAAHIAFTTPDIAKAIGKIEAAGWRAKGMTMPIPGGPRKGTLVAYVSGPDNITIELMQPPQVAIFGAFHRRPQ